MGDGKGPEFYAIYIRKPLKMIGESFDTHFQVITPSEIRGMGYRKLRAKSEGSIRRWM